MSTPWVRVSKSLMKNRKKARVPAEVMPSEEQERALVPAQREGLRQGEAVGDVDPEVVGGQRERPGVDHHAGRGVQRRLGLEGHPAPQLGRPERGRHVGAVDELEGLGVDGRLHVQGVLLAGGRRAKPGADAAAQGGEGAQRIAGRELAVGRGAEHVEVLQTQGAAQDHRSSRPRSSRSP